MKSLPPLLARSLAAVRTWCRPRSPWRAPLARRAVRRLGCRLDPARRALLDFGAHSSDEFTALAESLGRLDGQLAEVRTQASGLERTLRDHDEDRALSSAFELYKKSVDLAHASIGIALSQEEEMAQMENGLLQHRDHFHRNNLLFRVLVMNLRAEAARIDPENRAIFAAVAGDMAAMEQRMAVTLETAFTQLEDIVHDAAEGRVQLLGLQDALHHGARQSISLLRGELDRIQARLAPCLTTSGEINRLLNDAAAHTTELVTSLQYQDIVRQQLEHVGDGLADIATHLAPGATPPDLGFLNQAVRVQHSQLATSRTAIVDAGRHLDQSCRALLGVGSELVGRLAAMEAEAAGVFQGLHVGDLFARETAKLVATASQGEVTNDRITRLLTRIEESIRLFSSELSLQEFEVQIVALNAQISAARMPLARALNKLAEETSQLARQSSELSRTMTGQLGGTLARLNGMRREADEVRLTIGREKADLANGSVLVAGKLARLNERITRHSSEVARRFDAAYAEVRGLLESLHFPAEIAAAYAPAEAFCNEFLAATADARPDPSASHGALAAHQRRYTMHQERAAHAAALGVAPAEEAPVVAVELFGAEPVPEPPLATAAAAAPSGADNIELF